MDTEDAPRANDPLALLARQDLEPLSVADLQARIAALETEIVRCRNHMTRAATHRASADAFFKR